MSAHDKLIIVIAGVSCVFFVAAYLAIYSLKGSEDDVKHPLDDGWK